MFCSIILIVFGYWLFRYIIVPILFAFFNFYVLTIPNKHIKIIKNSGEWAVVTGSTDGIGREYCRQLAKLGLKIFLIGRDESKLISTSKELKQYYKIDVMYFKADLTSNLIYEELHNKLKDLDIGVLVNNVGMTQKCPTYFHEYKAELSFLTDFINCNILSCISLSKIVAPGMCERKRGIIINVSSASTIYPMIMSALYSSTKSFISYFSRTIHQELSNYQVMVQTVLPFYVQTKFIGAFRPPRFLTPTAEEYVESSIRTVGIENETFGTFNHSLQGIFLRSLPEYLLQIVMNYVKSKRRASHRD